MGQNSSAHVARSAAAIWELLLFKWSLLKVPSRPDPDQAWGSSSDHWSCWIGTAVCTVFFGIHAYARVNNPNFVLPIIQIDFCTSPRWNYTTSALCTVYRRILLGTNRWHEGFLMTSLSRFFRAFSLVCLYGERFWNAGQEFDECSAKFSSWAAILWSSFCSEFRFARTQISISYCSDETVLHLWKQFITDYHIFTYAVFSSWLNLEYALTIGTERVKA